MGLKLLMALGFMVVHSPPPLHTHCFSQSMPLKWKACIHLTQGSVNQDILYFFHGRNGNEHRWVDSYKHRLKNELRTLIGTNAPKVVTISFGSQWLLYSENTRLKALVENIIPTIEHDLNVQGSFRRILWGDSMGGFNALRLALAYPSFAQKLILTSPAYPVCPPYWDWSKRIECAFHHPKKAKFFETLYGLNMFHDVFKSKEAWEANDTLQLASQVMSHKFPEIFMSCSRWDAFSFFKPSQQLAELAKSLGVNVLHDWHEGGHSDFNPELVANFILTSSPSDFDGETLFLDEEDLPKGSSLELP